MTLLWKPLVQYPREFRVLKMQQMTAAAGQKFWKRKKKSQQRLSSANVTTQLAKATALIITTVVQCNIRSLEVWSQTVLFMFVIMLGQSAIAVIASGSNYSYTFEWRKEKILQWLSTQTFTNLISRAAMNCRHHRLHRQHKFVDVTIEGLTLHVTVIANCCMMKSHSGRYALIYTCCAVLSTKGGSV